MNPRRQSLWEIHVAVLLFGFPGLFGKWIPLSPHLIVFGRVFFAALALGAVLALGRRSLRIASRGDAGLLAFCGLILAVHWTLFFQSVQVSSVAVGLLAYSSFPVFTVFLEPLLLGEPRDRGSLGFALLCVLGIALIVPGFDLSNSTFQGVLYGLGAGLTFSILSIANRRLVRTHSSLKIAFYQDLLAMLFLLPFVASSPPLLSARTLWLLALLGIFCTGAAHTLFIKGMKHVGARTASILSSLEPVYGIVLALAFLGEVPALRTIAGGALILAAALVVTVRAGRPPA
ncbi:MAG: DMT family transporter [Candidatus Aminicenantes bacterium]